MKREARLGETSGQVLSASAKKLRFRTQRSRPNCFEPAGRIRPDRLAYCARRHIASPPSSCNLLPKWLLFEADCDRGVVGSGVAAGGARRSAAHEPRLGRAARLRDRATVVARGSSRLAGAVQGRDDAWLRKTLASKVEWLAEAMRRI